MNRNELVAKRYKWKYNWKMGYTGWLDGQCVGSFDHLVSHYREIINDPNTGENLESIELKMDEDYILIERD